MAIDFRSDRYPDQLRELHRVRYYTPDGQQREVATNIDREAVYENPRHLQYAYLQMRDQVIADVKNSFAQHIGTDSAATTNYRDYKNTYTNQIFYNTVSADPIIATVNEFSPNRKIKLKFKVGKRMLEVSKNIDGDSLELSEEDIDVAKVEYIRQAKIAIITKKSEARSEELLRGFIIEMDFRSYKQNGFFTIKQGNKLFRIYKDKQKKVDVWERSNGVFVPKSRLCVHTSQKELPDGDEALARLLLVRSGGIEKLANKWDAHGLETIEERELVLV